MAAPASATPTPIPDDFSLALRIADSESDDQQPVPTPDAAGIGILRAGRRLLPPSLGTSRVVDRLAVRATGPEYVDAREQVSPCVARRWRPGWWAGSAPLSTLAPSRDGVRC